VTEAALFSVTAIDPDGATFPDQPSPALPPPAVQLEAFADVHVRVMLCPVTCVAALVLNETDGAGTGASLT